MIRNGDIDLEGSGANKVSPIGYAGARNRELSVMVKLENLEELFAGRHFDREVIILRVRWYLRFKLSLRDLVEMMAGTHDHHAMGPALHTGV
jgi:hypothetical protein